MEITKFLNKLNDEKFRIIVIKSTIPPQTIETKIVHLFEKNCIKKIGIDFGICVNPEFLKEGSAIMDMLNPHLVVIGTNDKKTRNKINLFYRDLYSDSVNIQNTNFVNAELIKYVNNSFLATKISFINSIANICGKIPGADVEIIAKAIGMDPRIGKLFLKAGPGYGGSCFPKDVTGFLNFIKSHGNSFPILESTHNINQNQPDEIIKMIKKKLQNISGKTISILGLSFKKNTDDIREAVSIKIVQTLLDEKAIIKVHDPMAMPNFKQIFNSKTIFCNSIEDCLNESDCCVVLTEWDEYEKIQPEKFKELMKKPIIIDARRIFNVEKFKNSVDFSALGYGE
jgi:UDPglucose 6-dehydrogenase